MVHIKPSYKFFFIIAVVFGYKQVLLAQKLVKPAILSFTKNKLSYSPDSLGNRIIDFSYCGYKASEVAIPDVEVKIIVPILKSDATKNIQAAINYVASLPLNAQGFRGAVLLQKGNYSVSGQIFINATGIVLRGDNTSITGEGLSRATLLNIVGKKISFDSSEKIKITDNYVQVNATSVNLATIPENLKSKKNIIIQRPSTKEWIEKINCDIFGGGISALGWKPKERDLFFDRSITNIDGNKITIDAPITTALDANYGGGYVYAYEDNRITNCGVENIKLVSTFNKNNVKDEDHRWNAINIENAVDCWVRQMSFENFAGSAVSILSTAKRITVEDCISKHPVSEIGGQRRYTFLTSGQQTLFQRCYSENSFHDFSTEYCAAGPNAFVQCEGKRPFSFSGGIDSWSSGTLFDIVNIDGNALRFGNRGQDANGAGWASANSVFWNCTASRIDCYQPPTAQNYSFGSWAQFSGDGYWTESNNGINPRSLFYEQLKERLNKNVDEQSKILFTPTEASSSPTVEVANELTRESAKPRMQLEEWIATKNNYLQTKSSEINKNANAVVLDETILSKFSDKNIKATNTMGGMLGAGNRTQSPWWNGGTNPIDLQSAKIAITRSVPGKTGKGLTDNLQEVVDEMKAKNILVFEQNYGLWYDRRRDDHERIRRMDGEVWPPFYELPFARTGIDTAWDGLSKYDLTKNNPFYWNRLKQFADLADANGLVLINHNYFQHNIIEAGAHNVDFPWRTANNINQTGFPEPIPFAGDKRIFMADQFYDINDPVRRELHKKYIRQCLNNFKDNKNVIQFIAEEFTGPLHFVQFWLDEIAAWEKETGKHPNIGLSVTKDVQDAILADPIRNKIVDIIDIRYWHYQVDGTAYEPKGGQNLAPRQWARILKPKKTSFEQVYRAVREYKEKYPDKLVMYSGESYPEYGIAAFMAGGILCDLPKIFNQEILLAASKMKPVNSPNKTEYILSDGKNKIIYNTETKKIAITK